jgi:hypothetical protein
MWFLFSQVGYPGGDVLYFVLTAILLAVALVILWKARSHEAKLILLGLLVAVVAVGYGTLLQGGTEMGHALMRIGVILVLGGLAVSLLSYFNAAGDRAVPPGPVVETPPTAAGPVVADAPAAPRSAGQVEEPRHEV